MQRILQALIITLLITSPVAATTTGSKAATPETSRSVTAETVISVPGSAGSAEGMPAPVEGRIMPILPPEPASEVGFLGQDHAYTVTFRGNGESVVSLRVAFSNTGSTSINSLTFRIPKILPQDIAAFQIKRDAQCVRYLPYRYNPSDPYGTEQCAEYQEPNYFDSWWGTSKYFRADTVLEGDQITVALPNSVAPNASGSVLVYYRGTGYATRTWTGGWSFAFETAKVPEQIRNLTVGIQTDGDQVLKGAGATVNYGIESLKTAPLVALDSAGASSAQLDRVVQQIGQGSIVKRASDLQPLDSFTVNGEFAGTAFQLYSKEIAAILLGGVALITGGIFLVRFLLSRYGGAVKSFRSGVFPVHNLLIAGLAGFGSALAVSMYTVLMGMLYYLMSIYSFDNTLSILLAIGLLIFSTAVYLFLFTVPPLITGVKKGFWTGVATAVITLCWLGAIIIVVTVLVLLLRTTQPGYPVQPLTGVAGPVVEMTNK